MTFRTKIMATILLITGGIGSVVADICKFGPFSLQSCPLQCEKACKPNKKKKSNRECCRTLEPEREFHGILTFDQVVEFFDDPGFSFVGHRAESNRPGTGDKEVIGTFEICFNEGFTAADYRLSVWHINDNNRNRNEMLLGAFLVYGDAATNPANPSCRKIVSLCNLDNTGEIPFDCGNIEGDFTCCGRITNNDLSTVSVTPTVASLAELVRAGQVFVVVNGAVSCDENNTPYNLNNGGLIRAQLFPAETGSNA